ncbi:cobalamin biosynthesis protein CobQ [Candidatus Gottesmanbacteria bacterium]|nr:cobalamin biosynthesis protein CobQ [Candidatus Gottesmanbacteria bacterium]
MNYKLTIGWLYPDYMSTYGDRGNIICLTKRCQWRKINVEIKKIEFETLPQEIDSCDLIIGGGAQDRQQELVAKDLLKKKNIFRILFNRGVPGLFVCGSPQLLGHYYMTGDGKKLAGLGIFDYVTKHFGHDKPRCIGNTVAKVIGINTSDGKTPPRWPARLPARQEGTPRMVEGSQTIVGFENHGGRTYLGSSANPFAKVLAGYGNNGEDGYEGAIYKNVIACYYHGPFLPKNPHIADWLLTRALEVKYKKVIQLGPLDDGLEWQAHDFILNRVRP